MLKRLKEHDEKFAMKEALKRCSKSEDRKNETFREDIANRN